MESSLPSHLPYLGIRFTHSNDEILEMFKLFMTSYAVPLIMVIEEADDEVNRTHTHSLIQTPITINTFRKQLKKKFPDINGNKDFSITQVKDPYAMLRYVAKGKTSKAPNVLFSNFDSELVAQAHLDYWKENVELKKSHKQSSTPKQQTWTDLCWLDVQKQVTPFEYPVERQHIEQITKVVLQHLGSTARKLSQKIISDMVWGFANALIIRSSEKSVQSWTEHVADVIYRDHPFSL